MTYLAVLDTSSIISGRYNLSFYVSFTHWQLDLIQLLGFKMGFEIAQIGKIKFSALEVRGRRCFDFDETWIVDKSMSKTLQIQIFSFSSRFFVSLRISKGSFVIHVHTKCYFQCISCRKNRCKFESKNQLKNWKCGFGVFLTRSLAPFKFHQNESTAIYTLPL